MKKVYKHHYCKCGCGKRIQVDKQHKYHGIPVYIRGHNGYKNGFKKNCIPCNYIDGYHQERAGSKRRGLGFIPINDKNELSNTMHHIDESLVIFEPKVFHEAVYHSYGCSKEQRKLANRIAWMWYSTEWFYNNHPEVVNKLI
jgi:hypothetical protein